MVYQEPPSRFADAGGRKKIKSVLLNNQLVLGNEEVANWIIDHAKHATFAASEVLIKEGDLEDDDVLFLISGEVKITIVGKSRVPVRRAPIQVGEMSALNPGDARSATVTAHKKEVVTLRLTADDFNELCSTYPEIENRALREQNDRNKAWKDEGTETAWYEKFLSARSGAMMFAALFSLVFAIVVWQWSTIEIAVMFFSACMALAFFARMYINLKRSVVICFLVSVTATVGSISAPWTGKLVLQGTGYEALLQYGQNLTTLSVLSLVILNAALGVFAYSFWIQKT